MYKRCSKCDRLTLHTSKMNYRNGKNVFKCSVCGNESSGMSPAQRAILEEKRAEVYKEKTFEDVMNSIHREMNRNENDDNES